MEQLIDEACTWTKIRVVFRKGNIENDNVFFWKVTQQHVDDCWLSPN